MAEFKPEIVLNALSVRKATLEEAQGLLSGEYSDTLLTEWIENDRLLITEGGDLFIMDAKGLLTAQKTLDAHAFAWEDLLEILEDNCFQAESYNVATAVALLAAGWRPSTKD